MCVIVKIIEDAGQCLKNTPHHETRDITRQFREAVDDYFLFLSSETNLITIDNFLRGKTLFEYFFKQHLLALNYSFDYSLALFDVINVLTE